MTSQAFLLEALTWQEAEALLTPDAVIMLPLGAAAKEHGPHLPLNNDRLLAKGLTAQVQAQSPLGNQLIIGPTINTHFYPAFVEYPGSISLRLETARDLVIDICQSLARFGPKRFYVLNTGISTLKPLALAAEALASEGILLHYTDLQQHLETVEQQIAQQEGGSHADEVETSMMLYLAPEIVRMEKAVKDYSPHQGRLTLNPQGSGTYSPTGIWGEPTLATREKGERLVHALVDGIVKDLQQLTQQALPVTP